MSVAATVIFIRESLNIHKYELEIDMNAGKTIVKYLKKRGDADQIDRNKMIDGGSVTALVFKKNGNCVGLTFRYTKNHILVTALIYWLNFFDNKPEMMELCNKVNCKVPYGKVRPNELGIIEYNQEFFYIKSNSIERILKNAIKNSLRAFGASKKAVLGLDFSKGRS